MKVGILVYGLVGKALSKCYRRKKITPYVYDIKTKNKVSALDILNVCIPYTKKFSNCVIRYIKQTTPQQIIIHSTVPVGTADFIKKKTKKSVISSPIRGDHNNLFQSIKTFVKYLGCDDTQEAAKAAKHLRKLGIKCKVLTTNKSAELLKLLCTTYYGICIKWHESMSRICQKNKVNFKDVTNWNNTYNIGYKLLKKSNVIRPVLYPPKGKIGGTCIIPNAKLLKLNKEDKFIDVLLSL